MVLFNAKAITPRKTVVVLFNPYFGGVHTFTKGICMKVKVIARLEYELAYDDSAVQHFNHDTTRTPLL